MANKYEPKNSGFLLAAPFFAVMAVLTIVSFIPSLRPVISESEKRELAKFPEFSLEALTSGDYFDDITLWFSDTFPGREGWISASQYTTSFHGYSEIAIDGVLTDTDSFPVEAPTVPEEIQISAGETAAPQEAEVTTAPTEEEWGGVDIENYEVNLGTVIQIGDAGYNQLGFSQPMSDQYIETISGYADRMAEIGVRVISAPPPTSVGIMIAPEYLEQLNCARQDEMLNYLHSNMSDNVVKVDTVSNLIEHNDEYIYFRTDHHWTQRGAYLGYEALSHATGERAVPFKALSHNTLEGFLGYLYNQANVPEYSKYADKIEYFMGEENYTVYARAFENGEYVDYQPKIYTIPDANNPPSYSIFMGGDHPFARIETNNKNKKTALVIKDSYANAVLPLLTNNYEEILVIDPRNYYGTLDDLLAQYDIDDCIVINYIFTSTFSDYVDNLERIK